MREALEKRKRNNIIDFIEVPIKWGRCNKEFLGFDLEHKYFFRIFFDNKYRQDNFIPNIDNLKKELSTLEEDKKDIGIYSTKEECAIKEKEINFIEKYII